MKKSNPCPVVENPMLSQKQYATMPCKIVKGSSKRLRESCRGYWLTTSKEKTNNLENYLENE